MKSKIEKLMESYVGDHYDNISKKGKKSLERIFKNEYDSLLRTQKVIDYRNKLDDEDERGLLRRLEGDSGTIAIADVMYEDNPDYFNSLFSSRINCFYETGNPLFVMGASMNSDLENLTAEKKVCLTEIKCALESYDFQVGMYLSCFN